MKYNSTNSKEYMLRCGERVKKCREKAGLSQEELSAAIESLPENNGKTRSDKQISYIECGQRRLSFEYARLISQVLNVDVDYLLGTRKFPTDKERLEAICQNDLERDALIGKLIELLGYEVITLKQEPDGSLQSMHRPFSRITINKSIDKYSREDSPEKILEKAHNAIPIRIFVIKSPTGERADIEMEDWFKIRENIIDYIKFQCDRPFHRFENHFLT